MWTSAFDHLKFNCIFAAKIKKNESDLPSINCPNASWEVNDAGICQPKSDYFNLQCNANGMIIKVSNELFPGAKEVTLQDKSCAGIFDSGNEIWSIQTMLDGCDTSLKANDDGTLTFSNKLQVNAFRKRDTISNRAFSLFLITFFNSIDDLQQKKNSNGFNLLTSSMTNATLNHKKL